MRHKYLVFLMTALLSGISMVHAQYGTDVKVYNQPALNEQHVAMDVAFNGWVYEAFSSDSGYGLEMSKDNGDTWTPVFTQQSSGVHYSVKLVVAGTDTNYLRVFLLVNAYTQSTGLSALVLQTYNGATGTNLANPIIDLYNDPTRGIDMVTDYKFPSVSSSPYSIGVLYVKGGANDSLLLAVSTDSGAHFNSRQLVDFSPGYLRNVSLSYGICSTWSNGRFFMAWDHFNTYLDTVGNVFTAFTANGITDVIPYKVDLDSTVGLTTYRLCHPKISTSQSATTNNASGDLTTLVTTDYIAAGTTNNTIIGFSNVNSVGVGFWNSFNLVFTTRNTPQADVCYNPVDTCFMLTYYDATNQELPLISKNIDLTGNWITRTTNYVPDSVNLVDPWPTVRINPVNNQPAFAWSNTYNGMPQAMFDAAYRAPVPVLNYLTPDTAVAGTTAFTMGVSGLGFEAYSYVMWNSTPLGTTFIDGNTLSAVVPSNLISTVGVANVWVVTPPTNGGGGQSDTLPFFIMAPNGIHDIHAVDMMSVYPNPANTQLNISYVSTQTGNMEISLYDLQGRLVKTSGNIDFQSGNGMLRQDVSDLSEGIYQLVIRSAEGSATRKITVVR